MTRWMIGFLWIVLSSFVHGQEPPLERWDRAICLHTERKMSDGQSTMSTGFLVAKETEIYLVTARHSALDTHAQTRVVYRAKNGESQWVHLGGLVDVRTNPWLDYENTDLSITKLQEVGDKGIYLKDLRELAIPIDCLETETPGRTTPIEITGFPMTFGSNPPVAPLAMMAHIASKEMASPAHWGAESIFYAVPTVASGSSGGPVFRSLTDASDVKVVGIYIGLIADKTGSKLSKIIPSRVIRAAIEDY